MAVWAYLLLRNHIRITYLVTKTEYQVYLQSDHWKKLKARKLRAAKKKATRKKSELKCMICGFIGHMEVHHLLYKNIYDVELEDLRLLCRTCHQTAHELMWNGGLVITSNDHATIYMQTRAAVRKHLGLMEDSEQNRVASLERIRLKKLAKRNSAGDSATG